MLNLMKDADIKNYHSESIILKGWMGTFDLLNDPLAKAHKQELSAEINQIFHLDGRFQNLVSGEQLCNRI